MARAGREGTAQPIDAPEARRLLGPAFAGAEGVLLAVSGGPDSMALLALVGALPDPPALAVATVDHGLRDGSAGEATLVAKQAEALGLRHRTLRWDGPKPRTGLQEAAREARYGLLVAEARRLGFPQIATAHHADDQAETVLMRLAAGSGIAGLAGIRERSDRGGLILLRPLLGIAKARLVATCAARGIPFVRDPSNADPRHGRVRTRALLEELAGEGLAASRLARLAARAARADEALARMTDLALADAGLHRTDCIAQADWRRLATHPDEIRLRALCLIVRAREGTMVPLRLERMEGLLAELDTAAAEGRRLRRSIADSIVTLQSGGRLTVSPAPPRRIAPGSGTLLE